MVLNKLENKYTPDVDNDIMVSPDGSLRDAAAITTEIYNADSI